MDEKERVARAICAARGFDPDSRKTWKSRADIVAGRLQFTDDGKGNVHVGDDRRVIQEEDVTGRPAWEEFKLDAAAAIKAIYDGYE